MGGGGFPGSGFGMLQGDTFREGFNLPNSGVIENNSFVIDQKEKLSESGCLFF